MTGIVGMSKGHVQSSDLQNESNQLQSQLNRVMQQQLDRHEDRILNLEDTMRVNGIQEQRISSAVNKVILIYLGGKNTPAYKDLSIRGKAFSGINRDIKRKFGIPRRSELPAKDYDDCMKYIQGWLMDRSLVHEIESINSRE